MTISDSTATSTMGKYSEKVDEGDLDNHSNQLNPNNERYADEDD